MDPERRLAGSVRPYANGWRGVVVGPDDTREPQTLEGRQLGPTQDEAVAAARRLGWSGPFRWTQQENGYFDLTAQVGGDDDDDS